MAQTGIPAWSKTAASNATADGNINWAEGQAPSSVNDSARAMMAAHAKWRDDNSGSLTTGGTSTAFTVTTNQTFDSLSSMSGQTLRIKFSATNGASPTLNVDGLGAKNLILVSGTAVPASYIISGAIYDCYYDNSIPGWILVNSTYQFFQSGTALPFFQSAAPSGWTKSTANDNAAIRIVSGSGGSTGGTANFTTAFASRSIAQANLPSVTLSGTPDTASQSITPTVGGNGAAYGVNAGAVFPSAAQSGGGSNNYYTTSLFQSFDAKTITFPTVSVSLGGSGTALDFAVKYLDHIICTKN